MSVALLLSGYLIYKFAHHTNDNYSIPNQHTKLDQTINSSAVK